MRLVKSALSQLDAEKAAGRPVRLVRSAKLAVVAFVPLVEKASRCFVPKLQSCYARELVKTICLE
jgi:hypothetical protein